MFTGIISDVGVVIEIEPASDSRLKIACHYPAHSIAIGASIACSGICLTVIDVEERADGGSAFTVQASAETRQRSTLGRWTRGTKLNLERALKAGDELGGHIVSGHVDGIGMILAIRAEGQSRRFSFHAAAELAPFIASKGSICLDGTSFTVNEVDGKHFGVNIIPHTLKVTTWGLAREGDAVNIEIDMLARYVARLQEFQRQ
jgi:riboflavin synthase